MEPRVLQISKYGRDFEERVAKDFGSLLLPDALGLHQVPEAQRGAIRALLTMGTVGASAELMDALPNLGIICCYGSGYEKVDVAAAKARGIVVTNSPTENTSSVADLAVTLLLASVRRIRHLDASARSGQWRGEGGSRLPAVKGMTGRKIGILGLGTIGGKIAKRVAPFEVEIGYHNRRTVDGAPYRYFATSMELAQWADVLVVALRADPTNRHIVDASILKALGPDGHVVNISRGTAIDESALIAALRDGTISGAGLDVYEHEPEIPAALRELPNVVLSPHMSASTHDAYRAMQDAVIANLASFFSTGRPVSPIPECA